MTKTKFYKTAALAMTLSMVIGSAAFASTQSTSKTSNSNISSTLDSLVTAGTITQSQEDAAVKLITSSKGGGFQKGNNGIKVKLDGLVTAGTITQAQEDAMISALANSRINTHHAN